MFALNETFLAPSLLAGDHGNLLSFLQEVENDGRKWIHLDLMDGHFVPNLSFGPSDRCGPAPAF